MLSSFTLVSLIGVLLGVMVLIVVMAVYAGMEREVKARLLGFTPHVLVQGEGPVPGVDPVPGEDPVTKWQDVAAELRHIPGVESATAYVQDNVVLDVGGPQRPVEFRAIDSKDPQQVEGIRSMLDLAGHPDSSADMGLDDRVVISSQIAEQFKVRDGDEIRPLRVGDTIRLLSTRNIDQMVDAYRSTENPPLRVQFKESWDKVKAIIGEGWDEKPNAGYQLTKKAYDEAYLLMQDLGKKKLRTLEADRLTGILNAMDLSVKNASAQTFHFTAEERQKIRELVAETDIADGDKMDGEVLKSLKQIVLPKEAKVIGVYQASQMAITPDLFMPLSLAQDLSGLDDAVMGISLRLHEPYAAGEIAKQVAAQLDSSWHITAWMNQPNYERFFSLISQQRVMMYFALSFIVLVAAFSMMAVMFTVTILKRREIGVMKALGASSGQIVRVFLYQGMLLGAGGAALGLGLGRLVIHFRGQLQEVLRGVGFDPFAASFTGFTVLPAYNDPREQLLIALSAFVLCALAATVPAFFASRNDAAKSLRNL